MSGERKTIIVSNRLPVTIEKRSGSLDYKASEGGLATGLNSIHKKNSNLWIGWPGTAVNDEDKTAVITDLQSKKLVPVFLSQHEIDGFYKGFSNETLWPLFHYFPSYAKYKPTYWKIYQEVNRKYADAILKIAGSHDTIWIHDYQLLLVPQMIREQLPDAEIGFFQHIPFPSQEIFRALPWSRQLLEGILGADLIGFHTYDDVRHFLSSVSRICKMGVSSHEIFVNDRMVITDAFPISIDYANFSALAGDAQTLKSEQKIRKMTAQMKVVLSIDRLDYSKGILNRLEAYNLFLEQHPELHEKVTYVHIVVPSRDSVHQYKTLKEEMNKLISEINGKYSTLNWHPIQHLYRSFSPHMLSALYKLADVALVTPLRDGMNLVSKEYVASQVDKKGVLVLSETAGAAIELSEAIHINPNDIWTFSDIIYEALNMPAEERALRMTQMQYTISKFNINTWTDNFLNKLNDVKLRQKKLFAKTVNDEIEEQISNSYSKAGRRLLLLDYDGTLVPFQKNVNDARPDEELFALLKKLADNPENKVVIISGRDYATLEKWVGHLQIDIVAEHGVWHKNGNRKWQSVKGLNNNWREDIYSIIKLYTGRTPGSLIEEKSYSLAWHYRKVEPGLSGLRVQQLINDIQHYTQEYNLQILRGDKVIEVKPASINKGVAAARWLEGEQYDFIMAIGDDTTDEDTFKAMPERAVTVKVGRRLSAARYHLKDTGAVRLLLKKLTGTTTGKQASVRNATQIQADPIS